MTTKPILFLLALCGACTLPAAESWELIPDGGGPAIGPFPLTNGTKLVIDGRSYTLKATLKEKQPDVVDQLRHIRVKTLTMKKTDLRDVINQLARTAKTNDPRGIGVAFQVQPVPPKETTAKDGARIVTPGSYPRISLDMRDASLLEVLNMIEDLTGASIKIKGQTVLVYPK